MNKYLRLHAALLGWEANMKRIDLRVHEGGHENRGLVQGKYHVIVPYRATLWLLQRLVWDGEICGHTTLHNASQRDPLLGLAEIMIKAAEENITSPVLIMNHRTMYDMVPRLMVALEYGPTFDIIGSKKSAPLPVDWRTLASD